MKRFILIGVLFFIVFSSATLFGEDILLKEQIRDFLIEKNVEVMKNTYGHLNLMGLRKITDQKNYKDYEIYKASIDMGILTRYIILKKNDDLYLMPRDFNKLLVDSDNLATKENELAIAEKYVELCRLDETIIEKSEIKKVIINGTTYDIQIISWTKVNGVRIKWNFTFKDGQIYNFASIALDVYVGNYIRNEDIGAPSKGSSGSSIFKLIHRTTERTESVLMKNHSDEEITFEDFIVDSSKIEYPLLQKVFPEIEFFVETSEMTMPRSKRIVGKLNDEKIYLMPWQFNILFEKVEKNSKASIEERIESFVLLIYWLEDNNSKLLSNKSVSKKVGSYTLNREVKVKVNEKEIEILLLFKDNQIIRAEIFIEGFKRSLITPKLLAMRDVNISIEGVTGIAYPPGTHYHIPVSNNETTTHDTITFDKDLNPHNTLSFVADSLRTFLKEAKELGGLLCLRKLC